MGLSITQQDDPPLSLDDAKAHLRIATSDGEAYITDDDALLIGIINAACDRVERYTGRMFRNCEMTVQYPAFPAGADPIVIPRGPLVSVDSFTYYDSDNGSQTYTGHQVDTLSVPGLVYPAVDASWPATKARIDAVTLTISCGYDIDDVPPSVIHAMKLFTELEYDELDPAKADRLERRVQSLVRGLVVRDARITAGGD